jgi:hypothetical protein
MTGDPFKGLFIKINQHNLIYTKEAIKLLIDKEIKSFERNLYRLSKTEIDYS